MKYSEVSKHGKNKNKKRNLIDYKFLLVGLATVILTLAAGYSCYEFGVFELVLNEFN